MAASKTAIIVSGTFKIYKSVANSESDFAGGFALTGTAQIAPVVAGWLVAALVARTSPLAPRN